ncbi:hypothetical protein [Alkaliflexus imshenetskii]|uniref:hypothetical protein n=1 Tax=Alkaliflexus imshenetskii TaxID=286730 RepID=UPI00047A6A6A|nr:hypothetical protein [Alkaliflexus imshenetskii]
MWIIILSIIVVFALTWFGTRMASSGKKEQTVEVVQVPDADCCGAHEVCDKETLLSSSDEIVYYDDEELDAFRFKPSSDYAPSEIETFREVLYTMRDDDVAGWLRSLQLRNIAPPAIVREEALMIVADIRDIIRRGRQ